MFVFVLLYYYVFQWYKVPWYIPTRKHQHITTHLLLVLVFGARFLLKLKHTKVTRPG